MASDSTVAKYLDGDGGEPGDLSEEDRGEVDALRDLLHDPSLWEEPSASLQDGVWSAIAAARDQMVTLGASPSMSPGSPPDAVATAAASPKPATVVSLKARRSLRYGSPPSSRLGNFLAGLAVAAVIVGGVLIVQHFPTSATGTTASLAGQGNLPDAKGTVRFVSTDSGVRIELDATGLPRLDDDSFYEAWLKSADGTELVPVGTFHTGSKVTLWAGVSISDYPTFTVTSEHAAGPDDPAQGSSGDVVLKGTVSG